MKLLSFTSLIFVTVCCAHSITVRGRNNLVKEAVASPQGWIKYSAAPPDHVLQLSIGLSQPNFSVLEQHLYEISDPFHPRYGQHLSKEDVESLVAPNPHSVDAVNSWLASYGFLRLMDFFRIASLGLPLETGSRFESPLALPRKCWIP